MTSMGTMAMCRKRRLELATVSAGLLLMSSHVLHAQRTDGPLRPHPHNPRWFATATGNAVLLVGSHTWHNLQDIGPADPPPPFDVDAYLDRLDSWGHNFIRLWRWELTAWDTSANRGDTRHHHCAPQPWARRGPGNALDGKPQFDLTTFDETYFARLRERVAAARTRGIYVSVMLFEGWGMQFVPNALSHHPFHPENNVNGIGTSLTAEVPGSHLTMHELADPAILEVQEAYVRHVIDNVNAFDNVLYEISNETHPASTRWQYHMIRYIKGLERDLPKQHPVGMTFQNKGGRNSTLFDGPADWVSPNSAGGYRDNPPDTHGKKVVLSDTDHLWGIGGDAAWVWKTVTRGLNPVFMDPYDGAVLVGRETPEHDAARRAMGHALAYSRRMDLARATPANGLASSGFCLADPGVAYLVFVPDAAPVQVDLAAATGPFRVEWHDVNTGETRTNGTVSGGAECTLSGPFDGPSVLFLQRAPETPG